MHSLETFLTLATLATGVLSRGVERRAAAPKYVTTITTTETVLSTITSTSDFSIATDIGSTGALEIVPGVLTMTFNQLPAYLYLETQIVTTTVSTALKTKTVKVTTTGKATAAPTSTSTQAQQTPTTVSNAVPTKSLSTCNVEGAAGNKQKNNVFGKDKLNDIVTCQQYCFFTTACQSYSYNMTSSECLRYSYGSSGMDVVKGNTNTFFSQKYPGDGTNFCYGTTAY